MVVHVQLNVCFCAATSSQLTFFQNSGAMYFWPYLDPHFPILHQIPPNNQLLRYCGIASPSASHSTTSQGSVQICNSITT